MAMQSPLEVQKSVYGDDGPPMIFTPEASAFQLEIPTSPPRKRARSPTTECSREKNKSKRRQSMSVGELYLKIAEKRKSLVHDAIKDDQSDTERLVPCQLPGDFPPELSFRSLAAYSLLRTLSIQLRLSPFTPNEFLRALYLPTPSRLLGNVHVALLRILFVQNLKNMGYSYKRGGGGVGVHKRRQIDNIRWPLLAGDNLTHLDLYSWPLFYDDYCHLTADRLWASYHGDIDDNEDNKIERHNYIDFRNIGVFGASPGQEYKTKQKADELRSGKNGSGVESNPVDSTNGRTIEHWNKGTDKHTQEDLVAPDLSGDSDSEDEYQDGDDESDEEELAKPKRKKRKGVQKEKKKDAIVAGSKTKEKSSERGNQDSSIVTSGTWSRITSLESSTSSSTPDTVSVAQKDRVTTSDSSWSRVVPLDASSSSPKWYSKSESIQPTPEIEVFSKQNAGEMDITPATEKVGSSTFTSITAGKSNLSDHEKKIKPKVVLSASSNVSGDMLGSQAKAYRSKIITSGENIESDRNYSVNTKSIAETATDADSKLCRAGLDCSDDNFVVAPDTESNYHGNDAEAYRRLDQNCQSALTSQPAAALPESKSKVSTASIESNKDLTASQEVFGSKQEALFHEGDELGKDDASNKDEGDPLRIRGGGREDPILKPKQSIGRPRTSRRALPMRNTGRPLEKIVIKPHSNRFSMPDRKQQKVEKRENTRISNHPEKRKYNVSFPGLTLSDMRPSTQSNQEAFFSTPFTQVPFPHTNFETCEQDFDAPFEVPNEIAETLGSLIRGSPSQKWDSEKLIDKDVDDNLEDGKTDVVDDEFENELKSKQWLHFEPLKAMRSGTPYHRIPVDQKVAILEFLIDELLTIKAIADEFTKRHHKTDIYESPYGMLPNGEEYNNMENNDECAICGQEGDLLCCDGCVSSYHSACLHMKPGENLPEGKWLCPECDIMDPCNFGSLRGGRKSSLDWFKLNDLVKPSKLNGNENHDCGHGLSCGSSLVNGSSEHSRSQSLLQESSISIPGDGSTGMGEDPGSRGIDSIAVPKAFTGITSEEKEFLVVHGFVFTKSWKREKQHSKLPPTCLAMTTSELQKFVSQLQNTAGLPLSRIWPLSQVFSKSATSGQSFNPCLYKNLYDMAPIPLLSKVGAIIHTTKLMHKTYETECNSANISNLSEVLIQDMALDTEISKSLKTGLDLFDPFQLLKGYMLKLEQTLKKSCMLDEFWEGGILRSNSEIWISRVKSSASIKGLSRLLLKLVNAIQAQAFTGTWTHSHVSRTHEPDLAGSERNYQPVPADWSEKDEKLKRKWEMTPSHLILSLISNKDKELISFASAIRSDIFIAKQTSMIKSKRKMKKLAKVNVISRKKIPKEDSAEENRIQFQVQIEEPNDASKHNKRGDNAAKPDNENEEVANIPLGKELDFHTSQVGTLVPTAKEATETSMKEEEMKTTVSTHDLEAKLDSSKPVGRQEKGNDETEKSASMESEKMELSSFTKAPSNNKVVQNPSPRSSETKECTAESKDCSQNIIEKVSAPVSSKKKKGRNSKVKTIDPGFRRRTRRSGRLLSEHRSEGRPNVVVTEKESIDDVETLQGMKLQIENEKKRKIPGLEKLLKGQYAVQGIWPIAGRQVFPTIGNLPPSEMKRIARNAGSALGLNLTYQTNHEVAQVCYGHIWRKRVLSCNRFEELLHLMRTLESSLDRERISLYENQTKRGKTNLQKIIRISTRDPSSGCLEHFLMNKKTLKGCWVRSDNLDVSSLILDLFLRRQRRKEARQKRILEEKQRIAAEAAKKLERERLEREEAQRIAKLKKKEAAAKKRLEQELKKQARMAAILNAQKNTMNQAGIRRAEIKELRKQLDLRCATHELQVQSSYISWTKKGHQSIPEKELREIRQRTLNELSKTRDRLKLYNEEISDQDLLVRMYSSEENIVQKLQRQQQTSASGSTTKMPMGSENTKRQVVPLASPSSRTSNHAVGSLRSSNVKSFVSNSRAAAAGSMISNDREQRHQVSTGNQKFSQFAFKSNLPSQPVTNRNQPSPTEKDSNNGFPGFQPKNNIPLQQNLRNIMHNQLQQTSINVSQQIQDQTLQPIPFHETTPTQFPFGLSNSQQNIRHDNPVQNTSMNQTRTGHGVAKYKNSGGYDYRNEKRMQSQQIPGYSSYHLVSSPYSGVSQKEVKVGESALRNKWESFSRSSDPSVAKLNNGPTFNVGRPLVKQQATQSIYHLEPQKRFATQSTSEEYGNLQPSNQSREHFPANQKFRPQRTKGENDSLGGQMVNNQNLSRYQHNATIGVNEQKIRNCAPNTIQGATLVNTATNFPQGSVTHLDNNSWGQERSTKTQIYSQQLHQNQQQKHAHVISGNQQNQFHHNQYQLDARNYSQNSTTPFGKSPIVGSFQTKNPNIMKSGVNSQNVVGEKANIRYGNNEIPIQSVNASTQHSNMQSNDFGFTLNKPSVGNYDVRSPHTMTVAHQPVSQSHQRNTQQNAFHAQQQHSRPQHQNQGQYVHNVQNQSNLYAMFQQGQRNRSGQQSGFPPNLNGNNNYF